LGGEENLLRRALITGFGAVTACLVAAGCGSSSSGNGVASKPPLQIVQAAIGAMKAANSVHISGTITTGTKTIAIDANTFSNGDVDGTFTEGGNAASIIKIGNTDYLRTTAAFYTATGASSSIANLMSGKWIQLPDSSAGFGNQLTLVAIANSFQKNHGTVTPGGTSTINGTPVVSVHSSTGGTLYVATTGTPYPLQVTNSSKTSGTGTITLTQWNQGKIPTPPPGARTPASLG
jgi:hypothetical protein